LISCSSACGPMRWCFPILLFEVARFGEFRVEGSDSRIASHCENKPPHFSWITPRHFEISPETTGHVTAHLRQVPSTCTNSRIDEPCATGLAHSPKLFYCHYDGPSGQTTVGPLNATPQYHSDGALSQVLVTLICPLANYTEMHRVAAGNGTVRLSVTHSIPNAPVATSIPFQGLADGDTITFEQGMEVWQTSLNINDAAFSSGTPSHGPDIASDCSKTSVYFKPPGGCITLLEAKEGICVQSGQSGSAYAFRTDLTTYEDCVSQSGRSWNNVYDPDIVGGYDEQDYGQTRSDCVYVKDQGGGDCRAAIRARVAWLAANDLYAPAMNQGNNYIFVSP